VVQLYEVVEGRPVLKWMIVLRWPSFCRIFKAAG